MRQLTAKSNAYALLRDETLQIIPDNIDIFSIKKDFQVMISSKRRFERIQTIAQLIEVTTTVKLEFILLDFTLFKQRSWKGSLSYSLTREESGSSMIYLSVLIIIKHRQLGKI